MFKNKMVDMPGVHLFSRQIRRALAPQAGHDASIVVRFVKSVGCKHVKPDPSTPDSNNICLCISSDWHHHHPVPNLPIMKAYHTSG
jgi:hypothetical protein